MMQQRSNIIQISFYFVAITTCFCIYSLIQERIMTVGFGPENEVFKYSAFIVFINRIVACIISALALYVMKQPLNPPAPVALFAIPSVANVISSTAQYEALKYVNFPMQALAKCAKSVPVMAWSWITNTRKYKPSDYLSATFVTLGCALFVLTGDITSPTISSITSNRASPVITAGLSFTTIGIVLLSIFMIFDGLTCTSQDKLFSTYEMHSCHQLLYTSGWSACLSLTFLTTSSQFWAAYSFVVRHTDCLLLILMQSMISTTVQLFISFTIKSYGALNFALMMTMRQFVSILLSCLIFQHQLSMAQWLGIVIALGGLTSKSITASSSLHSNNKTTPTKTSHSIMNSRNNNGIHIIDEEQQIPLLVESTPRKSIINNTMNNNTISRSSSTVNDTTTTTTMMMTSYNNNNSNNNNDGDDADVEHGYTTASQSTPRNNLSSLWHPLAHVIGGNIPNSLVRQVSGIEVMKQKPV